MEFFEDVLDRIYAENDKFEPTESAGQDDEVDWAVTVLSERVAYSEAATGQSDDESQVADGVSDRVEPAEGGHAAA